MRGNIQLAVKKLNWQITTHALFSHVSHQPWAILLDSGVSSQAEPKSTGLPLADTQAGSNHLDAKFDIIVFDPIATLVTQGTQSHFCVLDKRIKQAFNNETNESNPLSFLNSLNERLYPHRFDSTLPFSGGAVGSFSYDLGRQLETLPDIAMNDIHLSEINIGFYDFCLIYSHQEKSWYATHYLGSAALDAAIENIHLKITKTTSQPGSLHGALQDALLSNAPLPFKLTSDWQCQLSQAQYNQKFNRVQQYLLSGDCYQINLTQRFSAGYQGDEWQAYQALSKANCAPFSAFIRLENHSLLSISPERFIKLEGNSISTKPIKGTLPRGKTLEEDKLNAFRLQASEKDRAENVMIVDLLRNDIGKVAKAGSVAVPSLFAIESFPAVHHLVSTVTATLKPNYTATDLLQAAFPGGSITGAPKIRAMEIIEELEPSRRSLYCGSIGYISQDGKMDTSITIRTLVAERVDNTGRDNPQIYCWAGGGIVADSNVEAEYQESFDKVSKILPILSSL
ncbi:aminodeoxychorismate synthase, subunit I [Shewanella denitrificans OS217]|jgi:para-aminobenzoate synthetase component I|uniref:aminodeoxychorismate synthase n=1 Tax=Shewanella denitrificans (strain OS217 / ATCC BAA-1090 / DSM 15013) TaxID=318161 RepID=Q12MY0_SHEDO|nr:aminodeoxychorismate synthase component I [Shewanella denitrificans]ABE55196.1 aminodeoxychorismate synthase, subunit I [Shewanella denitrificans OS217]